MWLELEDTLRSNRSAERRAGANPAMATNSACLVDPQVLNPGSRGSTGSGDHARVKQRRCEPGHAHLFAGVAQPGEASALEAEKVRVQVPRPAPRASSLIPKQAAHNRQVLGENPGMPTIPCKHLQ